MRRAAYDSPMATAAVPGAKRESILRNWRYVLATTNPPRGRMDPVSKWLYLTRAGVLPMTLVSASVAGLLAVYRDADVAWGWFALSAAGLVLAHMSNNLMNDLFDLEVGTDREEYPRNLYSPHPVLSGVVTRRQLASYAVFVNACCLAIMIVLAVARGWPIVAFALGGFVLSAAYTAPPLRLKKHGLGEPTVLVVWGPLMVGGTYYAATGEIPGAVVLASLPYALLCTTVLMGKHIDKIPWDAPDGTHTLPVLLGEARARALTKTMFVGFYASVIALVIAQILPVGSLLVFASLPIMVRTWNAYSEPKPAVSPVPNPVWPLWFAGASFLVTRRAGGLFVMGLIVGALLGW
jgi:1,4-dihydroxy-2-naphthoate octaprenyltransferase